jgi:hypothetical protein
MSNHMLRTKIVSDPYLEKGLPANLDAERAVLGAILLNNSLCHQSMELLKREDYFIESHRRIYDRMLYLIDRSTPIDLITLSEDLHHSGQFEQVGGATYVASLIDGVPRTDTIEPYAKIIKQKAMLRRLIVTSNDAIANAFDEEDEPEIIISEHLNAVDDLYQCYVRPDLPKTDRLVTVDELESLPPVEWLIPDILARDTLTLIYGQSGSYKSFYTLDKMLWASLQFSVVYVAGEGQSGLRKRLIAWRKHHNCNPGLIHFWLTAVNMLDKLGVSRFINTITRVKPDIVVFDTLSRSMPGGDENSSKDMTAFIDSCGRIQSSLDAGVLVVHHPSKNHSSERGHSSLRGACDVMIEITNDDDVIAIRCEKSKDEKPFETHYLSPIQVQVEGSDFSVVLLPADKVIKKYDAVKGHAKRILETLHLAVFESIGARFAQLGKSSGVPEGSIHRVLSNLKQRGLISQSNTGEPYFITEEGRKALEPSPSHHFSQTQTNESIRGGSELKPSVQSLIPHSQNEGLP